MAKRQVPGVPNRLAGKTLVFHGKFGYGDEAALKAMTQAQQGKVADDVDPKTDYLVLADLNASKTIQKKVVSLNGKGAAIQVLDEAAFRNLASPNAAEILALLLTGQSETFDTLQGKSHFHSQPHSGTTFQSENLDRVKLQHVTFADIQFNDCSFVGAELEQVHFHSVTNCDFSSTNASYAIFHDASHCKFQKASLVSCKFSVNLTDADFTGATLTFPVFGVNVYFVQSKVPAQPGVNFSKAKMKAPAFYSLHLQSPNFSAAELTDAKVESCAFISAQFSKAILRNASLVGCQLPAANFCQADLTGANLSGANLTGADFTGANLKDCNLRGANLSGANLTKAKNYNEGDLVLGSVGPALTELDNITSKAQRIQFSFLVQTASKEDSDGVSLDSAGLRYGWGLRSPWKVSHNPQRQTFSSALLELANLAGRCEVRFETVEASSTKSPVGGKQLRDLVQRGIAEAFAQELPEEEQLAEATKKYRDAQREAGAADREAREKAKAEADRLKEKEKKQIAKKIEKAVGKVSDAQSFLKALEVRIEKAKIDKATKMLKASGFKLFNDVTESHVSGVVKSQTDPDLVYACHVAHDGKFACCTQNLNVCGGLRGSLCKHQLVLIIGLVQAGELDPTTIDGWIAKTHDVKPELDKEIMGAIFIKYKGAEAGEVDWRPTETVPEDYYAL